MNGDTENIDQPITGKEGFFLERNMVINWKKHPFKNDVSVLNPFMQLPSSSKKFVLIDSWASLAGQHQSCRHEPRAKRTASNPLGSLRKERGHSSLADLNGKHLFRFRSFPQWKSWSLVRLDFSSVNFRHSSASKWKKKKKIEKNATSLYHISKSQGGRIL